MDQWLALVNTVIDLEVSRIAEQLSLSQGLSPTKIFLGDRLLDAKKLKKIVLHVKANLTP
jgi:hypothetical protein